MFGPFAYPYAHRLTIDAQIIDKRVDAVPGQDTVLVFAGRHETIHFEDRPVPLSRMRGHVVIVRADSGAVVQDVVHAIDVALGAGARTVGLSR